MSFPGKHLSIINPADLMPGVTGGMYPSVSHLIVTLASVKVKAEVVERPSMGRFQLQCPTEQAFNQFVNGIEVSVGVDRAADGAVSRPCSLPFRRWRQETNSFGDSCAVGRR